MVVRTFFVRSVYVATEKLPLVVEFYQMVPAVEQLT